MEPLVSILIPAYNEQEFIADTLRSAIRQTWQRKEIIVVDDGSTDNTLASVRRFASSGVSVVSQEHQGAAAARNKALSLCRGDYVQWLDANDLLAPDKISKQIQALEQCHGTRTLVSCAWGTFFYRPRLAAFESTGLWCDLSPMEWLLRKFEQNLYMQTATWLVGRELTAAAGPWDTRLLGDDDGEYFGRVLLLSNGVRFVPDAKVFYRISGADRLSYIGRSNAKMEAQLRSMELTIKYLRFLDDGERARTACLIYMRNNLGNFFPERPDIVHRLARLADDLGGRLESPRLSWKYSWIAKAFGPYPAKRARILFPAIKWSLVRRWDKTLFRFENLLTHRLRPTGNERATFKRPSASQHSGARPMWPGR